MMSHNQWLDLFRIRSEQRRT